MKSDKNNKRSTVCEDIVASLKSYKPFAVTASLGTAPTITL